MIHSNVLLRHCPGFTAALFLVAGLGGCDDGLAPVAGSVAQPLTYSGDGIFSEAITRDIRGDNPKNFVFRVTRGEPVSVSITKTSGNGGLRFGVQFSSDNVTWVDSPDCISEVQTGSDAGAGLACNDVTGASGQGWARVRTFLTQTTNSFTATFDLAYTFTGPCNAGDACYALDELRVQPIARNDVKKPVIPNSGDTLPQLYAGQSATITIVRSHGNINVPNGVKFKYLDESNTEVPDAVVCGAWEPLAGTQARMICTITDAITDGAIHVPLIRSNNTASPARWAEITIARTGAHVQSDRTRVLP